jgi:hypothetical protein
MLIVMEEIFLLKFRKSHSRHLFLSNFKNLLPNNIKKLPTFLPFTPSKAISKSNYLHKAKTNKKKSIKS